MEPSAGLVSWSFFADLADLAGFAALPSNSEIAEQLGLSHGTVRNYLSECIGKLGVANRIEAYRLARQKGWL